MSVFEKNIIACWIVFCVLLGGYGVYAWNNGPFFEDIQEEEMKPCEPYKFK